MPKLTGHDSLALQNTCLGLMVARCICRVHHVLCSLLIRLGLRLFHQNSWGADIGFAADVGIEEVDNTVEGGLGFGEVPGTTVSESIGLSSLAAIKL